MKGVRYWEYNVWKPDFLGKFTDTFGLFFDLKEYEKKKQTAMKSLGSESKAILGCIKVACIGPITADTAAAAGLVVAITANDYTAQGLVEALEAHFAQETTP